MTTEPISNANFGFRVRRDSSNSLRPIHDHRTDFGMRISDYCSEQLENAKSEIRIPKSEISSAYLEATGAAHRTMVARLTARFYGASLLVLKKVDELRNCRLFNAKSLLTRMCYRINSC